MNDFFYLLPSTYVMVFLFEIYEYINKILILCNVPQIQ